ncbi:MAG TPA: hypothetical protein VNJ50_15375, partial [Gelidibacter sp.]|uniref:hypothetical protein n=1 Tax=Gelidibacter sp. TaxID=2018083 RepID=UPI002D065582
DLSSFLRGNVLVIQNNKSELSLQLKQNMTKLEASFKQRDKDINQLIDKSKNSIVYSKSTDFNLNEDNKISFSKSVFIYDKTEDKIVELDIIKNTKEISEYIREQKDEEVQKKYTQELKSMMSFLQSKIEKFPEISKDIQKSLNIIKLEANLFNVNTQTPESNKKGQKTKIDLDVNDYDRYEDANRAREESEKQEEQENKIKFKR